MVETEFSLVRFHGDAEKPRRCTTVSTPLTADDIADCIAFAVTRPSTSTSTRSSCARDQANARMFHRKT